MNRTSRQITANSEWRSCFGQWRITVALIGLRASTGSGPANENTTNLPNFLQLPASLRAPGSRQVTEGYQPRSDSLLPGSLAEFLTCRVAVMPALRVTPEGT